MFGSYSLEGLRRGLRKPYLLPLEFNRLVHTRGRRWRYNRRGRNVLAEDWDTLLVLDACRYDTFEQEHDLPGTLERRESVGANTYEWLRGTFDGRTLHDTVYVTANPQLYRLNREFAGTDDEIDVSFHDVVDIWQDGWEDDVQTVRPERVANAAREAHETYPNKRHIVHFIQPHFPFLGPTGREHFDLDHLNFNWESYDVSPSLMYEAYRENLQIVLGVVEELLADIEGRTVVTADHGEAFGERDRPLPVQLFAHRLGHYADVLVEVPWHVHENGPRRTVTADTPVDREHDVDDGTVNQRLRDLGYRA